MSEITKKALVSSLIALCDEKKLNKITVQDIVNKCGVCLLYTSDAADE